MAVTLVDVEDASEEIFWLYTQKQRGADAASSGLGFVQTNSSVLPISLTVSPPASVVERRVKGKKSVAPAKDVTVEFELQQDLNGLRNRPGDTGSVLWRLSVHLAQFLLGQHHFPPPHPLFPNWAAATVLELGSGSGFLGLALGSTVKRWTYSDQLSSLDLVVKNLRRNGVKDGDVCEIDWFKEEAQWAKRPGDCTAPPRSSSSTYTEWPDYIIAADCIFAPSLSQPLARTLDLRAGPLTTVLVASELRDAEPLEVFLEEWVALPGWAVQRAVFEDKDSSGMGSSSFVLWIGRKK